MIVSINQPAYLPWLGYFHRIAASDLHIVLDHVQFEKNSFVNRNKIKTANGPVWLTVPVRTKGKFGSLPISSLEINNNTSWSRKHWKAIRQNYSKAPYFRQYKHFFEDAYARKWQYLPHLCKEITEFFVRAFTIETRICFSSQMAIENSKDKLVLALCQKVGATTYLSGALGRNYIRSSLFTEAGIELVYQDYDHPVYPQLYGSFQPFMSAIDLLFNCGPDSLDVLTRDQSFNPMPVRKLSSH